MARTYECLYIVAPDTPEDKIEAVVSQTEKLINDNNGQAEPVNRWGKRKMSYEIKHYREGLFFNQKFSCDNEVLKQLQRVLKLNENVLRFMITRVDE